MRFLQGDAEALPLADASVDGVISECSVCLVSDKRAAAAREIARVVPRQALDAGVVGYGAIYATRP